MTSVDENCIDALNHPAQFPAVTAKQCPREVAIYSANAVLPPNVNMYHIVPPPVKAGVKNKHRVSYGLCVLAGLPTDRRALVIQKKITDALGDILLGRYNSPGELLRLIVQLTAREHAILQGGYAAVFHYTFGRKTEPYPRYMARYTAMFVAEFLNTVPVGKLLWEFPKGKPARKSELPYDTALREFREETGVTGEITSLQIEQGSYTDHNEVARITYTTHMYIGYMDLVCGKWPQTKSSLEAQCAVWIPYDKLPLFIAANTLAAINYKL